MDCNICKEKPMYPYNKCCFNCSKDANKCEVWHKCGENCEEWQGRNETNFERIKSMTVNEMAEFMRTMLDCVSCQNKMMNNNNPFGKEKCNDSDFFSMCGGNYKKCVAVCKKWLLQEVESQ